MPLERFMFKTFAILLLGFGTLSPGAFADPADQPADPRVALVKLLPAGAKVEDLRPSPIPGIFEFSQGADVSYLTADGKFFLDGNLYDMTTRENLTRTLASDLIESSDAFKATQRFWLRTGPVSNKDYVSPQYLVLQRHGWINASNTPCPPQIAPPPCWYSTPTLFARSGSERAIR
jgi:hypothetical protein